jgi:hypothetical protein
MHELSPFELGARRAPGCAIANFAICGTATNWPPPMRSRRFFMRGHK